jgi:hypothetical protein
MTIRQTRSPPKPSGGGQASAMKARSHGSAAVLFEAQEFAAATFAVRSHNVPNSDEGRLLLTRRTIRLQPLWRETLIDAAIFREAITNNSGRAVHIRMAHFFCEFFCRARVSGTAEENRVTLPLSLPQLGETLGMAIATVNRTLPRLRSTGSVDFRDGILTIKDWPKLVKIGGFDPRYLHLRKIPAL